MQQQYWVQDVKPAWLPEGFQVPSEMFNNVQQLCQQAENVYYSVDLERNGFLRKKEFKKAMKLLGINKQEARHMLILIDKEGLKVVSIKNYVNAYLFIKSGGLSHANTDYQGPITSSVDQRIHMKNVDPGVIVNYSDLRKQTPSNNPQFTQNLFQTMSIPRNVKVLAGFYVSIKSVANGMYVCSENGRVIANRVAVGPWETFYNATDLYWSSTDTLVAFRTNWNTYLCCEYDNTIVDNRTAIGPWEKFIVEGISGSGTAFKSWSGKYLSVGQDGALGFTASSIGTSELFTIKYLHD